MGGERASTTRRRERGLICCLCGKALAHPDTPGERKCELCAGNGPVRRVYMHFMLRPNGWNITFLERDLKTSVAHRLLFADPGKILALARRGGADLSQRELSEINDGVEVGRGGVWLNLTEGQYRTLKVGLRTRKNLIPP